MRFTVLALLVPALVAVAAPVPGKRAFSFAVQDYSQFQISDGVGGNAAAEANAVFVTPFPADLTQVDATSLKNLGTMREAAEDAETSLFNPQIDAASGAAADALDVGKTKNKVLKLTGEVQQIKIKIAQAAAAGKDTAKLQTSLDAEQTKLTKNIALDVKNKGKASKAVA
ncbi:NAD(P)-binding protein [Favolaschia claudopus]|uniref:NAD(P)-binding protein n=1 Tax=Favolaschia claudopus TaxID=2862362 RepID=A0AAW0CTL9_9AGAR